MENNEQNNQEIQQVDTPETKPNKPKTPRKSVKRKTAEGEKENAKKTVRKPRTTKAKKKGEEVAAVEEEKSTNETEQQNATEQTVTEQNSIEQEKVEQHIPEPESKPATQKPAIPQLPHITISNIVELMQAPMRSIVLTDQQIQQLTLEEIEQRHRFLEETLARVLDYDVVISDTNIWLELLLGYTSSHSDPRYNARLQFERQLEFISRLTHYRGGRFMILGETYEEIDRFATMLDPTNHRDADFTDNIVCLNAAARLAKRLILAQQRENRLRICGIGAESHHAAFADPAIIKKVAELFAEGKKVLLMTNDASVAIRAMGICDDLQRHNNISDEEWDENYAPLRPMVFTFDDLRQLDFYTRQYHYIQMAAGTPWMYDIPRTMDRKRPAPLELSQDAFRPGDKHRSDNLFSEQEMQQAQQKMQQAQQMKKQPKQQQTPKQQKAPVQKQQNEQQPKTQQPQQQKKQQPIQETPVAQTPPQQTTIQEPAIQQPTATEPMPTANEQKPKPRPRRKPQRRKPAAEKNEAQQ